MIIKYLFILLENNMSDGDKKIDKKNIKLFFEGRAKTHNENHPLKSVIYQDKNPGLAIERDILEKKKIKKILNISKDDVVLDIGCGIGRWADGMSDIVKKYVGIDFTAEFINIAKKKYKKHKNIHFICLDGSKLSNPEIKSHSPYSIIMILGLYPYIDNKEGYNLLKQVLEVTSKKSGIIIREPIALEKELILNNVWSDDMDTNYTARYRTQDWFKNIFADILFKEGYKLIVDEPLFPDHLNNRKETRQHLFYLKKNG